MKQKNDTNLEQLRHSLSHVLAAAVLRLWPDVKLAIGPAIDNGFYYDFDFGEVKITEADLPEITKEMIKIINQRVPLIASSLPIDEAIKLFKKSKQVYKQELAEDLKAQGETNLSFYQLGEFTDLCKGPHLETTGQIANGCWQLDRLAGAYWRGDEKNKMLTRIYGLAFASKQELADYRQMLIEAEKRDHRKLGRELNIFEFDDDVGPGLPLWLPAGTVMIEELERLAKETEFQGNYLRVRTPHIAKESMYLKSGHLPYYEESMFPPMEYEGGKYYLKAMNCPHHHKIFAARPRSYRELPLRLAEYGTCYRQEKSGELFGLMRVRSLQMNDAHIYCSEEQFAGEFEAVNQMYLYYFKIFNIDKFVMRFSTHDPKKLGKKYVDEPALWQKTEDMVRRVLVESKIPFIEVPNEAAFYGPKIDVQVYSAIGREFTLATNQVDFAQPRRFGLEYTDASNEKKTPLCIHRAPLGTHERFIGFLIEHYAGNFPVWLSPVQVKLLAVGETHIAHCEKLAAQFKEQGIRVAIDDANETVGNKTRKAITEKVPYILVIGDQEIKSDKLAIRDRGGRETREIEKMKFIKEILEKIKNRD